MVRIASRVALIFWLFTLVLGLVAVGCGGGGDDSPTAPGPGIEDPDPDGGIPGPGPGNGNGGQPGGGIPTTQADVRSGTTAGTGEVTLPGFERAPAGTKGRLPIRYAVFDSQGRPLAGVFITNIRQGGEFLGVIVAPGGDRAPRLFFSERIPDRLGSVEPERGSTVINKNQFGELVSSAMNIARDGDTLVVRITLPREANVNDEVRSDTQRNYFLDNDLADRLLSFGDLVSYRGTFSAGELAGQISNSLQGMGGYVYVAALVQDTNLLSNWRLAPAIATNPNDPTYRQFLEPMLTSTGSEIYWVQQLAVTSGATAGQIQADFNASFPNNPLAVNLGPDQRYLLVELDALKGQTSFTGRVRKLIYVIPLSPRSISLNTADGDGRFRLNQAENLHVTLDYVAGSSIPLGPMPTATAPFGTRVGLTATPIRPGDVVTRPPLAPAVTAVDELQRNVQAFYFIPDFFGDADTYNQGVLGGDCVNCLRSNVLPLVGPNGVVTNLPPRVEVQIVSPTNPSPRLPAAGLPVKVGFDGTSDPDNEIVELVVDWGDDSPDTVVTNATGPINFDTLELTHTYTDAGNRTITATVRDNGTPVSTAANAASLTIIANALPVACLETTPAAVDGVIEGPAPLVITFDVGCSTDPDSNLNAPVNEGGGRISADFGDSVRINNESFALYHRLDRTYFNAGEYNVVFTIIDADGGTDTVEVLVRVLGDEPNMDPVAVAGADVTSGEAPLTVHFMGSGSSDPDGSIVTYIWNFDDGTVPGGGTSTQPNPVYVYQQPGNYNPTLTVIDNEDASNMDSIQIQVFIPSNQQPTAVITAPQVVELNQPVQFSSDMSSDPDGSIVAWAWDFGDGNVSTEPNPTHTYTSLPEEGFFIVTLQVTDDGAPETGENPRTGIAQHQLQVVEAFDATLPWAIIVPSTPVSGVAPLAVELDASASYSPVGATITDYQWLFSDTSETTTGPTASHTFKNPGTWFVTLTVTDSAGRMGSESIPIYVAPSEPAPDALVFGRATAAPLEALPGSPIQFSSVGTFDPEGQPFEIVGWDFDGNPLTLESIEPNPTWSFDTIGLHSVTLVAHEILPLPDPSRDIRVPLLVRISTDVGPPNSNPVGLISADTLILDAAGTINFTALVADVEDAADRLEVEWDLGGLGTATGLEASQEFTDPGTYDVTTTIRDRDGGTTTHSIKVAVLPLERPAGPMIDIGLPDGMLVFTTGDTLNLDLSNTRDPEGENVMVSTDWGDGTTPDEGTTIGHQYENPGRYTVTVTALDESLNTSTRTFDVVVTE